MKKTIIVLPLLLLPLFSFSSCSKKNIVELSQELNNHYTFVISKGNSVYFKSRIFINGENYANLPSFAESNEKRIIYEGKNLKSLIIQSLYNENFSITCKDSFSGTAEVTGILYDYGNNNYVRVPIDMKITYLDFSEEIDFPSGWSDIYNDREGNKYLWEPYEFSEIVISTYSGWAAPSLTYCKRQNMISFRIVPASGCYLLKHVPFSVNNVSVYNNDHVKIKNFSALTYDYEFYENLEASITEDLVPFGREKRKNEEYVDFPIKDFPVTLDPSGYDDPYLKLSSCIKMALRFEMEDDYNDDSFNTGVTFKFDVTIAGEDYTFYRSVFYERVPNKSFCKTAE